MTNDKLMEICEKATQGPWTWGDGWKAADESGSVYYGDGDNSAIEKYMDMALRGLNNKPVIPIRIDHYEMMYDGDPITPADRELISVSRAELPRLVRDNEALREALKSIDGLMDRNMRLDYPSMSYILDNALRDGTPREEAP